MCLRRAGVVLVDCPGCQARHLVADRKGWFGDKGSVEDFLAEHGEAVRRRGGAGEDALEITAEELAGWSSAAAPQPPKEAAQRTLSPTAARGAHGRRRTKVTGE